MARPFRRQTIQEAVLAELRRLIHDGELGPGEVIRLDDVAEALQVSRIPVREALKVLEGEGLVAHRPHLGYAVPSLTPTEIEEIYRLRTLLEGEALDHVFAQPVTEDERAAAHQACTAAEQGLAQGDANAFSEHARRFHRAVLAPCRMPRLLRLLEGLWDSTESYRPAKYVDPAEWEQLQAEHRAMLDAFLRADRQRLADLTDRHREHLLAATLRGSSPAQP
jgi:DNA-binding GntR family transcriptional regulator